MMWMLRWAGFLLLGMLVGVEARAAALAGVCPDGSAFVVQSLKSVPCERAKLVPPSELPPLRPELLPRPYTWHVDREARDPHNPYNVIDAAQKIRALRRAESEDEPGQTVSPQGRSDPSVQPTAQGRRVRLSDAELRDVARLVELHQQIAPAELPVDDVRGRRQLTIRWAHSAAVQARILGALGEPADARRVLIFTAQSPHSTEFYPSFLIVQGALTFRPEPDRSEELGFLAGEPGPLEPGGLTLGYLVIPARFDLKRPLDLWWNDRSLTAILAPST